MIPQFSGHLTRARIWKPTIFVDHFSNHLHVHLMRSSSQDKMLASKCANERLAATHEVTIQRYHTDNGRFAKKSFRAAVDDANQSISYCGVGTHRHNGIFENHIKQITLTSRTLLLYAKQLCPDPSPLCYGHLRSSRLQNNTIV